MKTRLRITSLLLALLIGVYAMLFEWRSIFERPYFIFTVNLLKIAIPSVFLLLIIKKKWLPAYSAFRSYVVFFILFMAWGFISSIFSSEVNECIIQWLKHIPLFIFCYFICLFSIKNERAKDTIMRFFIIIAIFTAIQYAILTTAFFCGYTETFSNPTFRGGAYRGPFGLFGQGGGMVFLSCLNLSLFRLYGFWLEPSKAAGFLLTSAFFAEIIFLQTRQKKWKIAKFVCFTAGIATFSNTAYLCMGVAGLAGELFMLKTNKKKRIFHSAMAVLFILLSFFAIFGRFFVAKYQANNIDLRYVVGVRDAVENPYGGRIELLKSNVITVKENAWLGIGFRIPGKDEEGRGYKVSASAPIYWLTFTGIIGFILLMLRELQIVKVIAKNMFSSVFILRVSQLWLALFVANLSYGTLMSPFYFIVVAVVFSSTYHFLRPKINITQNSDL